MAKDGEQNYWWTADGDDNNDIPPTISCVAYNDGSLVPGTLYINGVLSN